MEELTDQIDQYLSGTLSDEALQAFEARLANDVALQKEVELQRKTVALLEAAAWQKTKEQVVELSKKSAKPTAMIYRVAAIALILLVSTYFIMHANYSNEALYADYKVAYPDYITTMGTDAQSGQQAMEAYNQGDYASALKAFEQMEARGELADEFKIYEAIALMETGQTQKSIGRLQRLMETDLPIQDVVSWNLALAYLANDQGEAALLTLEAYLAKGYDYQREKAQRLRDDLASIWR